MRPIDALPFLLMAGTPQSVAADPGRSPIDQAVAARNAGDYMAAITLLEAERSRRPGDATILRLLGTSYAFAGRHDEAIAVLRQARAIAPADQDIALALARAYLWTGRVDDAATTLAEVEAAEPSHLELPALRVSIANARRDQRKLGDPATLSLSQSVADVAFDRGGGATWYSSSVELALPVPGRTIMTGSVERESRQGTVDTRVALRADRRIGASSSGYIEATATPNADFREHWSVRGGGETALHP